MTELRREIEILWRQHKNDIENETFDHSSIAKDGECKVCAHIESLYEIYEANKGK